MTKIVLCGIKIDNVSKAEALDLIERLITQKKNCHFVVTPNVDHIVKAQKDYEFNAIYRSASLVLPDGVPLLWASKFLGTPLKERITGSDLFPVLCKIASRRGYRVFFLGGRTGAADQAAKALTANYPALKIVGTYCPPFGFENDCKENEHIITMIKDAQPDILFVGLGAPKQEKWIYKYKDQYKVPVSIGIGVSFEFVAGIVRRAPQWMQQAGLEWLWRLLMEPGRLCRRYLIDDPEFFGLVIKQKLFRNNFKPGSFGVKTKSP